MHLVIRAQEVGHEGQRSQGEKTETLEEHSGFMRSD